MCTDIPASAVHSTSSHAMLCRTILPRFVEPPTTPQIPPPPTHQPHPTLHQHCLLASFLHSLFFGNLTNHYPRLALSPILPTPFLPRDWSASDAATLCEGRGTTPTSSRNNNSSAGGSAGSSSSSSSTSGKNSGGGSSSSPLPPSSSSSSRRQTEAAVRCAVETSSFSASSSTSQKLRLTHAQVEYWLTPL